MTASRLLLAASVLLLAGCSELPKRDPAKAGPFYTPSNVTSVGRLPAELRRVAILPAHGGRELAEVSLQQVDEALAAELTRAARFETVIISRAQLRQLFGATSLSSTDALPPDFMEKLARVSGADGVLFTDITHLSPYPPLALGLRTKLAALTDGEILWSADNLFSASQPDVANAARRHALKVGADRGPGDLSHTVLQNPTRFAGYAVSATLDTLPTH